MSYRPHPRMARTDPGSPRAWGTCEKCGFIGNLGDFHWHREWVGPAIINLRHLVCERCRTIPNETLRTIILPPDPEPVLNARIEGYALDEAPGLRVLPDRHAMRVVIVSPSGPRRPLVTTGTGSLQTSF